MYLLRVIIFWFSRLCISLKEHCSIPLSTPIVRGIEKISFLHVDGDLTYMQRSQDISNVEKISENLSKLSGKLGSKASIVMGDICMFESHGKYYRCVVKSINSKLAVVHCIDFGYEKQVEKKKLQCLGNTKIALLPALVITVKTFPMACNMSRTMFLANMHVDHNGTLNALPNKMTLVQSQNKLMETLENGSLVRVTCINSSNDCWIVPHLLNENLKVISDVLIKMQSKMIPAITEIGSMCAALHSVTKKWHRALILDVDGSSEYVLSIDSGEKFKALKTTKLVSEIQKIPNCALNCQVVSNVDINTLLNKDVECKLISCTQPLLEVKLYSNHINESEITSTVSTMEWCIAINRFESFNEFYVKKVDHECNNNNNDDTQLNYIANNLDDFPQPPPIGTLVAALTDKNNGLWYKAEVLNPIKTNLVVRIISDGTVCKAIKVKVLPCIFSDEKLYFRCCLDQEIVDVNMNDPLNLDIISEMMAKYKWIMTTTSNTEPYKVTLTYDGVDCLDMLYTVLTKDHHDTSNNNKMSESGPILKNIELNDDHAKSTLENPLNNIPEEKIDEINLILPEVEIVVIKYVETFQYFYVQSESLSMLYMKQIAEDLDVSIVELSLNDCMVGSIVVTLSTYFNCWCRAKIETITDAISAKCYLLDLGDYEECTEFYKPTEFLRVCPPLVRRCSLYAPKLAGQENEIWFPNINDMFKDITSIDGVKFNMIIRTQGDPCVVSLQLEDSDVGEMMYPLYVQLTHVKSFTDFKIKAISSDQKCMNQLLESYMDTTDMLEVSNPIVGELYLTKIKSKYVRVKLESLSGCKNLVIDIDDTLDMLSVTNLYELPDSIRKIPMLCMTCSLILDDEKENYCLSSFQKLANPNVTFVMCIITENDGTTPNQVKLYIDNKDVLDFIKLQ